MKKVIMKITVMVEILFKVKDVLLLLVYLFTLKMLLVFDNCLLKSTSGGNNSTEKCVLRTI